MSRKIVQIMDDIFETLKSFISDDDSYRIENAVRHIRAEGDEAPVCDFVKHAKMKIESRNKWTICLFDHNENLYLLVPSSYESALDEIGLRLVSDSSVIQGAGMLAIAKKALPLRNEVTSIVIIERCLGIMPENGDRNIVFEFSDIRNLFASYSVYLVDSSIFQLVYEEDLNRLFCYLFAKNSQVLSLSAKERIKSISLLLSSRSIAGSLLNSLNSFHSSLVEYAFLQLYQCIEYLFRLNSSFLISEKHNISLETAIDIVVDNEFKISELDNLYSVLKNNVSEAIIDTLVSIIPHEERQTDKWQSSCKYIYKLRCNIAHLRYNQEEISDIRWNQCFEVILDIIFSIYTKCDLDIKKICLSKTMWRPFTIDMKG